jgi:hypothetical protein
LCADEVLDEGIHRECLDRRDAHGVAGERVHRLRHARELERYRLGDEVYAVGKGTPHDRLRCVATLGERDERVAEAGLGGLKHGVEARKRAVRSAVNGEGWHRVCAAEGISRGDRVGERIAHALGE